MRDHCPACGTRLISTRQRERIERHATEVVQARLSVFHGHRLADVRVYYEADDGTLRPTKKGIAIGLDLLPELRAAVEALERAAAGRGLAA